MDVAAVSIGLRNCSGILGGTGLQFLELKLRLAQEH
jgi:hypothetical protein